MAAVPSEHHEAAIVRPNARSGIVEIEQSRAIAEAVATMQLARRFPRDEVSARDKIALAFTSKSLAEIAKYSYARGGTDIEGPSIHSLRAVARAWGNIATGIEEMSRANGQSECRAYAIDTETGFKDEKKFVVKHVRDTTSGPKPLRDERDIYEMIANMGARRQRACLEAVIPKDVVDMAMEQVDVTLAADFEITADYLKSLEGAFAKYGVTKPMLEAFIQRHLDAMTPAQAARLKKIHMSLKDGVGKPEDWFDMAAGSPQPAAPSAAATRTDQVKDRIRGRKAAPTTPPPAAEPPPASTSPDAGSGAPTSEAPDPFTDEVQALIAMDKAQDEGEGEFVLARCVGQPWRPKIVERWNERFAKSI